jgi:single-strand DNA-binding protein
MEILVGRVTKDAQVRKTNGGKDVVNFSIAVNDNYKPKGSSETKEVVRYFNCAYWLAAGVAKHLTKGTLVELNGRIDLNTYTNMEGKTIASLAMHVNNIKLHSKAKNNGMATAPTQAAAALEHTEPVDDLPF